MNTTPALACAALLNCAVPAQIGTVPDVGLTMTGGILPVVSGVACGPFACVAYPAPAILRGQARTITHYGAPNSFYAVAVGLPPIGCVPVAGIANSLMLAFPVITIAVGVTGPREASSPCAQGTARVTLTVPFSAPIGTVFHMQSLGVSAASGQFAFGHAMSSLVGI